MRDSLTELFAGIEDMEENLDLREGACGCLTATLTESGRFNDVFLVHSNLVDDPQLVVSGLEGFQASGPIPSEASCIVGITMPITFYE